MPSTHDQLRRTGLPVRFTGNYDRPTCDLCRHLLGATFVKGEPLYCLWSPPLHPRCSHEWETVYPPPTGMELPEFRPPPVEWVLGNPVIWRRLLSPGIAKAFLHLYRERLLSISREGPEGSDGHLMTLDTLARAATSSRDEGLKLYLLTTYGPHYEWGTGEPYVSRRWRQSDPRDSWDDLI